MKKMFLLTVVFAKLLSLNAQCWKSVSGGGSFSAAVKTDGTLWQWGYGYYTIDGKDSIAFPDLPFHIGAAVNWEKVFCGEYHAVALKTDGTLWSWGDNFAGQLGNGSTTDEYAPTQIGTDNHWQSFSCAYDHNIALKTDGTIWSWGGNAYGQLGDGSFTDKYFPVQIGTDNDWRSVTTGSLHSMALKNNGTLWSWGYYQLLGNGSSEDGNQNVPLQIGTDNDWAYIDNTHAIKTNGTLWGWGSNDEGQLGDGTMIDKPEPIQIGTANNWQTVSNREYHTLAIQTDGTLWAWGWDVAGETGTNQQGVIIPTQIGMPTKWLFVATGAYHSLAITTNSNLWGWGENRSGELGDGSEGSGSNKYVPEQISCAFQSTLPVIIISFNAKKQGNTAVLNWQTATESNSQEYQIERSRDGVLFNKIGIVASKDNISGSSYSFKDLNALSGNNYYRIKSIDRDSKYSYSNTKILTYDLENKKINIYPNPANEFIWIENNLKGYQLKISISELSGRIVKRYAKLNSSQIQIPINYLNKGIYQITISDDKEIITQKFSKK